MGVWGHTERSLPHTVAVTPESLLSWLGRGGIGAPRGGFWARWGTGTPVGPEGVCHPTPRGGGSTRVFPAPPGPPGAGPLTEPVRRSLCGGSWSLHLLCSEARRAALAAPASSPAGGPGTVAVGGSTPNLRSVLPPSIAEGGVWGAEVPPSLQDTENAK